MPAFYPESESLVIGRIIRMIGRGALEQAIIELRELQERAAKGHHRNPPMRRGRRMTPTHYSSQKVGVMSNEVHAILYRHIEDGRQYRHNFENPTSMISLLRGDDTKDVLITSPDGFPIWQEF